jgi:hypothetical protein
MYKLLKSVQKSKKQRQTNKITNKTKKSRKQLGGGFFTTSKGTYKKIRYRKSDYITDVLDCLQCKNTVFRHHTSTMASRTRTLITGGDFWGKKYNIFVCNKCGFMMDYSGKIKYEYNK